MQFKTLKKDTTLRISRQKEKTETTFLNFHYKVFHFITRPKKKIIWKNDCCKNHIKNVCLWSGLERSSNVSKFRVSRHFFKKQNSLLTFPGIRKASW